jgi:hypothetical protein
MVPRGWCEDLRARAALEQHRIPRFIRLEQTYRWIAIPESQSGDLIPPFHVRHANLEHSRRGIAACGECDE